MYIVKGRKRLLKKGKKKGREIEFAELLPLSLFIVSLRQSVYPPPSLSAAYGALLPRHLAQVNKALLYICIDDVAVSICINNDAATLLLVVLDHWHALLFVYSEAVANRLNVVIGPLRIPHAGRPTRQKSTLHRLLAAVEVDDPLGRDDVVLEHLGLIRLSRKAVDEVPVRVWLLLHGLGQQLDGDFTGDDVACLDDGGDLLGHVAGAVLCGIPQQLPGAEVGVPEVLHETLAVRPFARARATEDEEDLHGGRW